MSSLKHLLRLKTPSLVSNITYTLLSVALTIILLVVIPHSIYKDIEQQVIHPEGLKIGPNLLLHLDQAANISADSVLKRPADFTQPFHGHTWLNLQLSSAPVWLTFPIKWQPPATDANMPLELFVDLGFATLNDVRLVVVDDTGKQITEQRSGDHIEEDQRPIPTSHPLFSFTIIPEKQYQAIIRIKSDSFLNTTVSVSTVIRNYLIRPYNLCRHQRQVPPQ